jgi:hypothetical protein
MSSLSAETLRLLKASFTALGHFPSEPMWRGIEDFAKHLQQMADGGCEPRFYLSSLDPGVGKTQTIIHFIRALLASRQHDHVGVIIFFYTKQQIQEVVDRAGLMPNDFAVLMTAEEEAEQELIDRGNNKAASARVLFTTQQRLQLVCRDKNFSAVASYHFLGLPRQVRIWDEALLPATETVVRAYDIPGLIPAISALQPEFVEHVNELCARLHGTADREVVFVPNLAATEGLTLSRLLRSGRGLSSDEKRLATDLWSLFGTSVSVRHDGRRGPAMVSYRRSVPDDLAPVVILDASGRVRTAYDWWHDHRRTLHRLTPVKKHYYKLTVHVWDIGGGQSSFQSEEARYWRTSGITKTINRKRSDKWLVICHKAFRKEVEADIRRELKGDQERVSFLHWGIHRASNEFCDVPNIILAGTQFLPPSSYEGIGRAACGLLPSEGEMTQERQHQIELGELADRVLQAACRGIVRKAVGDECPPCNVYIIASAGSGLRKLLPTIFPRCGIETWEPAPPRLRGKPAKALKFMKEWFADHPDKLLTVALVMEAIDEQPGQLQQEHPQASRLQAEPWPGRYP